MVFILSRNGYFTKQYDDYSKIMKIQDDANFLKTCEIYTVTIEGKSMQLDKFVKKNIMLFKKHDIHFCQYGTESSQDY